MRRAFPAAVVALLALAAAACGSSGHEAGGDGGASDTATPFDAPPRKDASHPAADAGHPKDASHPADHSVPRDAEHAPDSARTPDGSPGTGDTGASAGLHVVGNTLVDHGKVVRLLGVDHSGGEFSCVGSNGTNGYAFFDGPTDDSLVNPMLAWKVNAVRLPLNEECWLGINGVAPAYSGANYQAAVTSLVSLFRSHGIYVILDLHWGAPGGSIGTSQQPMADADHASAFWTSVASTFRGDVGVVFDLFNEPYLATGNISDGTDPWDCLENGCEADLQTPLSGTYMTAGMQALVTAVRATGAENVIMVSGLGYTSDLSGWVAHEPTDPLGNLAASLHLYNFNGCTDATCWNTSYAAVAVAVPIITGENGENDCGTSFVDAYMTWADGLGISYLGWSWNAFDCSSFPALISTYDGGVPTGYGVGLQQHLLGL
jgi:endoglucanase